MSRQLRCRASSIIPEEQATCHRIPSIPHDIGITGEAREPPPMRSFELSLRTVENGFPKCDGEAYPGAQDLRVVGVIVHVTAEHIRVHPQFIEEHFRQAQL